VELLFECVIFKLKSEDLHITVEYMKSNYLAIVLNLILVLVTRVAHGDVFLVYFDEGDFEYDEKFSASSNNNKYLASVSIKRNGVFLSKNIRGSTIPDSWILYQGWHIKGKNKVPPTDEEIISEFDRLERNTDDTDLRDIRIGSTKLADLLEVYDLLNRVPVLPRGIYRFAMGVHKRGESPFGDPYVPRLIGGTMNSPYIVDNAFARSYDYEVGGFIKTLNKNNAQGQKKIANGINVHDGGKYMEYKYSEGCLTIHPDYWEQFYTLLPSPEEWKQNDHEGYIVINRGDKSFEFNFPPSRIQFYIDQ